MDMHPNNPSPVPPAKPAPAERPYEPMVLGESLYDRVTSFLMSVVIGAALIVGWLWVVYFTNQAYAQRVPPPVQIIEVYGGGGDPEGKVGESESIEVAGAAAGAAASNNEAEDATDFEEPSVQATSSAPLDAMTAASEDMGESSSDVATETPRGGAVAAGRRASKIGTGGLGLGPGGPGDGGVSREQRWIIVYPQGQSADEYARALDTFGIELGTFNGSNSLVYGSNFSGTPLRRIGLASQDKRFYMSWQGRGRKQFDIELMKRAGIDVGEKPILQFFPDKMLDQFARLEVAYKGRQPAEIRQTRFSVVPQGASFGLVVLSQDTLR